MGPLRGLALQQALTHLDQALAAHEHRLMVLRGEPSQAIAELAAATDAIEVWSEHLPAPEEEAVDKALDAASRTAGWRWLIRHQDGLFDRADLPFPPTEVPNVFTAFRQAVQRAGVRPQAPRPAPTTWPQAFDAAEAWSSHHHWPAERSCVVTDLGSDPRSSFPLTEAAWQVGEPMAQAHWARYLARGLAHRYKSTRNGLHGQDFSTKLSPWLAWGAMSVRQAQHALQAWEARHGANEDSGWISFELLWREHFRLLHLKHGRQLYRAGGLSGLPAPRHDSAAFERWCRGETGHPLIDAGMRELRATGWLSNRMRQIVASYLIHDLHGDWRAGADWFESCLIDFDVFSNQGNWAYIAGRGSDPRGGRRFDPDKQAREHDPDGRYRQMWSHP
jgi:deoxyribodipyrimidine photo-lyase